MGMPKLGTQRKNIVSTLLNQIVTTACGMVIPRVLIGSFGSEAYAISVSITQFLAYIALLEGGVGGVVRGQLYGPLARKDAEEIGAVFWAARRFFTGIAVVFLAYSLILGVTFSDLAKVTLFSRTYIFCLVMVISLSTIAKYAWGLANLTLIVASKRQYVNNAVMIVTTLLNAALVILLVRMGCDMIWVKLGSSLIFVTRPLMYVWYVRTHFHFCRGGNRKVALEQRWTGIGQHIAYFLHQNTDVFLLTLFADVRLVAVYAVYNMVISSIRSITEGFSGGMEAVFGEKIAKGQTDVLRQQYQRYQLLLTSATLILFCCTGVLILPFVKLYTEGITDVNYIQPAFALVFLMAEAMNCLVIPCASLPVAANQFRQSRWGAYGEAAINIGVSCLLIRWNPLLGVAMGTLVATLFRSIYYICYSARHILHLPAYKGILSFAATILVLCLGILGGRRVLRSVPMENFFQWCFWGAAAFVCIGLPVAAVSCLWLRRMQKYAS